MLKNILSTAKQLSKKQQFSLIGGDKQELIDFNELVKNKTKNIVIEGDVPD